MRTIRSIQTLVSFFLLLIVLKAAASENSTNTGTNEAEIHVADLTVARDYYLSDLLQPHNYIPGKNSYLFQSLKRGQSRKVLNLEGAGSVRHMWFTWSVPGSDVVPSDRVRIRIYINHESKPSIDTTISELCHGAEATGTRFVPFPAFIYKDAYNIYLPVYFARGIRIELEAVDDLSELYTQIDFRRGHDANEHLRLHSDSNSGVIALGYEGEGRLLYHKRNLLSVLRERQQPCNGESGTCSVALRGQGIVRQLTFRGDISDDLELSIYWDGETEPSVISPFKYLFSDFTNTALASTPDKKSIYLPMPFHRGARIILHSPSRKPIHVQISYSISAETIPDTFPYFHAVFHSETKTEGYRQYPIAHIRGSGLFIGVNLFDSGHNHGGGDAALIDGASDQPHVLHGICGEDYFGFAWHHTGTMTPLTGAPVHERRYRLHLENPYPFHQSLSFLFGIFADQNPKSVAFWYQYRERHTAKRWLGVNAPWKIFGPVDSAASLAIEPSSATYTTVIPINKPTEIRAQWQNAEMQDGFIDLTYVFRHYVLTRSGSGFIVGASKTKIVTYIYSPTAAMVNAIVGQDDGAQIQIDDKTVAQVSPLQGLSGSLVHLPLRRGWNKLSIVLANDENSNWRWLGMSLALQNTKQAASLTFSSSPQANREGSFQAQ